MKGLFKIGEIAKAAGVNVQTLRYYEQLGLLKPASRKMSGYRQYDGDAVDRLTFIKKAQGLGFTLSEISELLKLRVSHTAKCGDVKKKVALKLGEIDQKIKSLQKMKKALKNVDRCCDAEKKTDECPLLVTFK